MDEQKRAYPITLSGLYKNKFTDKFSLNSVPLDQERADQMCSAIQKCIGGRIELKEAGGTSKNGKTLPDYFLEAVTAEILAERKAYGAQLKAQRTPDNSGDDSL